MCVKKETLHIGATGGGKSMCSLESYLVKKVKESGYSTLLDILGQEPEVPFKVRYNKIRNRVIDEYTKQLHDLLASGLRSSVPPITHEDIDKLAAELKCVSEEDESGKMPTRAECIEMMSIEELAKLIVSGELSAICPVCQYRWTSYCFVENRDLPKNCEDGIKDWLRAEVEM